VIFDGPVTIRGHVDGDVVAFHGPVNVLGGRVDGDITEGSNRIVLGPRSVVTGDLNYGDDRPIVAPGARVGGDMNKFEVWNAGAFSGFAATFLTWLALSVSSLVLGLVLIAIAPRGFDATYAAWSRSPGAAVGWGAVLFFGLPIAAVVALITLVGIPLGVALLLALVPVYAIGQVAGAFLLGRVLIRPPSGRLLAFLLGLVILVVLELIPILGALVWIVATVLGLGALIVAGWRANRPQAAPPATTTVPAG
jgi:cytoskeletal protein CcmA (bactofilin family)